MRVVPTVLLTSALGSERFVIGRVMGEYPEFCSCGVRRDALGANEGGE
jgi:hypothetical protein